MNEPIGGHVDPADAALLDRLRPLVDEDDPVPPEVVAAARAAGAWRRMDEALARLTDDSVNLSAGVRGGATRLLTFEAGELTIEIEVSEADGRNRVLGQVVPVRRALVRVEQPAHTEETTTDALGRFRIADLPAGPTRLHCTPLRTDGTPDGVPVRTQWTLL